MISRRKFIATTTAAMLASVAGRQALSATIAAESNSTSLIHSDHLKTIPSSNEKLPSIGMGTWLTFDVPDSPSIRMQRSQVLQKFFALGGGMVDSSPMYGTAEEVLGFCLSQNRSSSSHLFAASKIWTPLALEANGQMGNTEKLWGLKQMDLMYVHNLLNHESHLPKLRDWKQSGRLRYLGISTSHGRRHKQLESLMQSKVLDFVQLTYNYNQRVAEERLIPIARDNGIAVVVNRPFQRGHLIEKYRNQRLPGLAKELGCDSWAQFLLYFVVSHPDVAVAIPATTRVDHMAENMGVMQLPLPDAQTRASL